MTPASPNLPGHVLDLCALSVEQFSIDPGKLCFEGEGGMQCQRVLLSGGDDGHAVLSVVRPDNPYTIPDHAHAGRRFHCFCHFSDPSTLGICSYFVLVCESSETPLKNASPGSIFCPYSMGILTGERLFPQSSLPPPLNAGERYLSVSNSEIESPTLVPATFGDEAGPLDVPQLLAPGLTFFGASYSAPEARSETGNSLSGLTNSDPADGSPSDSGTPWELACAGSLFCGGG